MVGLGRRRERELGRRWHRRDNKKRRFARQSRSEGYSPWSGKSGGGTEGESGCRDHRDGENRRTEIAGTTIQTPE